MLMNYHIGRLFLSSLCVGAFGAAGFRWCSFCRLKRKKTNSYIYIYIYICVITLKSAVVFSPQSASFSEPESYLGQKLYSLKFIYIYIYMCVVCACVRVCVCMKER